MLRLSALTLALCLTVGAFQFTDEDWESSLFKIRQERLKSMAVYFNLLSTQAELEGSNANPGDTPGMDMADYVKFYLYTRNNPKNPQELTVGGTEAFSKSNMNVSRPTKIIVHGYLNDYNSEVIQLIKNVYLKEGDYNVIGVDWSRISVTLLYNVAAAETKHVGDYLSGFIRFLQNQGVHLADVHLVGHSLGAHVSGFAGAALKPDKLPRITGLDPAKPSFTDMGPDGRLDSSDAHFVDCIHTCAGELGLADPVCSSNFYPNGGTNPQPGCAWVDFIGVCSHERSIEYFAESILSSHLFESVQCNNQTFPPSQKDCTMPSDALMGHPASPEYPGVFYVTTNSHFAYALIITK